MLLELLIVFLLHEKSGADINPVDNKYTGNVNEDVSIPWIYDYESDMFSVEWSFKNSSSTIVILTKVLTNPAQVQKSFNIQHDGNGNITLKKVTRENGGIYYCKVVYTGTSSRATVTGTATLSINNDGGDNNTGKIVGGVLGGVAGVAGFIIAGFLIHRCLHARYKVMVNNKSGNTPDNAYIIITGSKRSSTKIFLKNGKTNVEGILEISTKLLGNLQECKIGYSGNETTWNLEKFTIKDKDDFVYEFPCQQMILSDYEVTLQVQETKSSRGIPDGRSTVPAGNPEEATQDSFEMESKLAGGKTNSRVRPQPPPPGINPNRDERASAGDVKLLEGRPVPPISSDRMTDRQTRGLSSNFNDHHQNMPNDQHQNMPDVYNSLPPAGKRKTALKPVNAGDTDDDDDEKTEKDTMRGGKKTKKKNKKNSDD